MVCMIMTVIVIFLRRTMIMIIMMINITESSMLSNIIMTTITIQGYRYK